MRRKSACDLKQIAVIFRILAQSSSVLQFRSSGLCHSKPLGLKQVRFCQVVFDYGDDCVV